MRIFFRWHSIILLSLLGCVEKYHSNSESLFQLLSPHDSGISFNNQIEENDTLNILNYEYMFNGGGVGVIDVNNDGLNDLFFTGNLVANKLYLNRGNLTFEDISEKAGIRAGDSWCTGVSVVDINTDGWLDIYVCVGGPGNKSIFPNKLFINQGDNTFVEMAKEYGLNDSGESNQATFFDYDRDGDLDMYLLTGGGLERSAIQIRPILMNGESRNTDRLYENSYDSSAGQPVFRNVSKEAGITIEGYGLGVSIIDANQDTWPDVYVSNDYLSRDFLYINNKDKTFTDRSLEYFKHASHFSMGNDVGDVNNDGLMDIITLDMLPNEYERRKLMFDPNQYDRFYQAVKMGYGYQYMRNALHLNHGDNGFSEIGQLAGIEKTDWSWAPLLADFDNDGYLDLYITNGFGKDITDLDFVNFRREASSPFSDQMERQRMFMESAEKQPPIKLANYAFSNNKDLTFAEKTYEWGLSIPSISNGAVFADLDNDGDLEIIINNINEEAFVFKNTSIEKSPLNKHFLKVKLIGPKGNSQGLGAYVSLYAGDKTQHRYVQVARGFQSSVENTIHFGMGAYSIADSITVFWPDGLCSTITSVHANQTIEINYGNAMQHTQKSEQESGFFTQTELIEQKHREMEFNDFRSQPTLLHGRSKQGPGLAVGDVNGDGLDDLFIGGAYGSDGSLFVRNSKGHFDKKTIESKDHEDLGAIFFDADGDQDLDLYVASGGSERYPNHEGYMDRLYMNDGNGNFTWNKNALPDLLTSNSVVTAADFDNDGDEDLFVGGRVTPTQYPVRPKSYMLENENGTFTDVAHEKCPLLADVGMVTSAIWSDFNNDNEVDLILAGEFMRITLLKNNNGKFADVTDSTSLAYSFGMWNSIVPVDYDNDGDMDYVAGNLGLNSPLKASVERPFKVHYSDFDNNGTVDPIFSMYEGEVAYPFSSFDQLKAQLPILEKLVESYGTFAKLNTNELLQLFSKANYQTLQCTNFSTSIIENLGGEKFEIRPLPIEAQFAPVNGILAEDVNMDGLTDLVLVGNDYSPEVVHGRYDAFTGLVLINKGDDQFEVVPSRKTKFLVNGDAKALVRLELANRKSAIITSQNNDVAVSFTLDRYAKEERIYVHQNENYAIVTYVNGAKNKIEFPKGGAYLSQSSRSILVHPQVEKIQLFSYAKGQTRELQMTKELARNR